MRKVVLLISNLKYFFKPKFLKLLAAHAADIYKLDPIFKNRTFCDFLTTNHELIWKTLPFLNAHGKFRVNFLNKPMRVVVGASGKFQPGWIGTDVHTINLLDRADFSTFFVSDSIDAILAEHVWEHLIYEDGLKAARNCHFFLKEGGYVRIAVPDGFNANPDYIQQVKPGGSGSGSHDHKELYNYVTLSEMLSKAGFKIKLLEYYDENGVFHENQWSTEDGLIQRSRRYDPRNNDTTINYSSLIVDAVK